MFLDTFFQRKNFEIPVFWNFLSIWRPIYWMFFRIESKVCEDYKKTLVYSLLRFGCSHRNKFFCSHFQWENFDRRALFRLVCLFFVGSSTMSSKVSLHLAQINHWQSEETPVSCLLTFGWVKTFSWKILWQVNVIINLFLIELHTFNKIFHLEVVTFKKQREFWWSYKEAPFFTFFCSAIGNL